MTDADMTKPIIKEGREFLKDLEALFEKHRIVIWSDKEGTFIRKVKENENIYLDYYWSLDDSNPDKERYFRVWMRRDKMTDAEKLEKIKEMLEKDLKQLLEGGLSANAAFLDSICIHEQILKIIISDKCS